MSQVVDETRVGFIASGYGDPLACDVVRYGLNAGADHAVLRDLLQHAVSHKRCHWVLAEVHAVLDKALVDLLVSYAHCGVRSKTWINFWVVAVVFCESFIAQRFWKTEQALHVLD